MSLPTREAWIEIIDNVRAPEPPSPSLPTREAWIEILHDHREAAAPRMSLPTREAWIEIHFDSAFEIRFAGRFLHGKRGLKS